MDLTYLSVVLVQELHHTIQLGRPIDATVSGLRKASLPGILEYGCLRRSLGSPPVPDLPEAITSSPVGLALREVRSELGLRVDGPEKPLTTRTDPRSIEFQTIRDVEDLLDRAWEMFLVRFEFATKKVGFHDKIAAGLSGALGEMTDNAVNHARAPVPALVGYEVRDGMALFSVVDAGIGVLASLRSNPAYSHLTRHKEALRLALQNGTSSVVGDICRGLGFHQVFKSLAAHWGHLRFRSGKACIEMDGTGLDADQGKLSYPPLLPGFQVTVCCRSTPPSR